MQICAQEACNLLTGLKSFRSSHAYKFIDTSCPEDRTRVLRDNQSLKLLADDSVDIAAEGWEEHYTKRPAEIHATYCQFSMWYNRKPTFTKKKEPNECQHEGRNGEVADDSDSELENASGQDCPRHSKFEFEDAENAMGIDAEGHLDSVSDTNKKPKVLC